MARVTKSTRSVVFTLFLLLAICSCVFATGRQVECKTEVDDYSTMTIGWLKIPNPLAIFVTAIKQIKKSFDGGKDDDLDTFDHPVTIIRKHGFRVECYAITSNDSYTTQLFRILPSENSDKPSFPIPTIPDPRTTKMPGPTRRPTSKSPYSTPSTPNPSTSPTTTRSPNITTKYPIFLGHGLLSSAVDWLLVDHDLATTFELARNGYEVWLWNSRGNRYSMEHEPRKPTNKYWDFGVHEMAVHDIPEAIDYMLEVTEAKKINYIGYSMTTTTFHIMMSERPEYNEKINKMVSLAPAVYVTNTSSPAKILSRIPNPVLLKALQLVAGGKVYPPQLNFALHRILPELCDMLLMVVHPSSRDVKHLCQNVVFLLAGHDAKANNSRTLKRQAAHMPTDTSARTVLLYLQYFNKQIFNQYDFGVEENIRRYNGSRTPPEYDLTKTKGDMMVIWGGQDDLINKYDAEYYMSKLTSANVTKCYANTYSHLSFVYADCQWQIVLEPILEYFRGEKPECPEYIDT